MNEPKDPQQLLYEDEELVIAGHERVKWKEISESLEVMGEGAMLARSRERREELTRLDELRHYPHTPDLLVFIAEKRCEWKQLLWRLFPFDDLPVEVITSIFNMAVTSPTSDQINMTRLRLSQVCSSWRSIVTDIPSVWSVVQFNCREPHLFAKLCLSRAKTSPLTLVIDRRDPNWTREESDDRCSPEEVDRLMDIVIPYMGQVLSLFVLADTWSTTLALLDRLSQVHAPPMLQRFEIIRSGPIYVRLHRENAPPKLLSPMVLFGGCAPALQHVTFHGVHVNWSFSPLRNLRVLELRKMGLEVMPPLRDFRIILESSPLLDTLCFDGSGPIWSDDELSGWIPITLPQLMTLNLSDFNADYALYILQLFTAPRLRRLALIKLDGDGGDAVIHKVTGAFPLLSVLTVTGLQNVSEGLLKPWLCSMPRLNYLKVAGVGPALFLTLLLYHEMEPPTETKAPTVAVTRRRIFVCPQLKRKAIGCPLEKVNASEEFKRWLHRPEFQKLRETRSLNTVPLGSRPDLDDRYVAAEDPE